MLTTSEFRRLVESTTDAIAQSGGDLRRIYEVVGLPAGNTLKLADVSGHLTATVQSLLPNDLRPVWLWVQKLQRGLIVEHLIVGLPLEPYLSIASALRGDAHAARQSNENSEVQDWAAIVQLCRYQAELLPRIYSVRTGDLALHHPRSVAVAEASQRLHGRGYHCDINNGVPVFPIEERQRIVAAMEGEIAALGGFGVAERIFGQLSGRWHGEMQRYLLGRRVDAMGTGVQPELPFGYLLQLAVKHMSPLPPSGPPDEQRWTNLLSLARDFAAIYDVQPYSVWELENTNSHSLSEFVQNLSLCDRFFGLRQLRTADVAGAISGLFDWVKPEHEQRLGWSIASAARVAEAIFVRLPAIRGPSILNLEAVVRQCSEVPPDQVRLIVNCLTHANTPNRDFVLPESASELTFTSKPVLACEDGNLVIIDPAMCAPACFEALAGALQSVHKQTFSELGFAVERFLTTQMNGRNVRVLRGSYQYREGEGECDCVIETDECIIFGELKIKSLTRAAQAGNDLAILVDLSSSLFDAASQCNRHEVLLRKRGSITLKQTDGTEITIERRGRRIEKMALTFDDFGSFQDRTVIFQLFVSCLGAKFDALDPELQPKLENLNKKARILAGQFEELATLDAGDKRRPFFNFWFLSVPQMLVLLDHADSNESFKQQLWLTRHLASHSLDFYADLGYIRNVRQK